MVKNEVILNLKKKLHLKNIIGKKEIEHYLDQILLLLCQMLVRKFLGVV